MEICIYMLKKKIEKFQKEKKDFLENLPVMILCRF